MTDRIKIMLVLVVLALGLLTPGAAVWASESLSISVDKTIFYPFEDIVVHMEVTNDNPYPVVRYLESGVSCVSDSFIGELTLYQVELESLGKKTVDYTTTVLETMPAGEYIIGVRLLTEDFSEVLDEERLSIEIRGTKKIIDIRLLSCKDKLCSEEVKVFILYEDIYLDYRSPVPGLIITGVLTLPDGSTKEIALPTSFPAEQIGTHELEVAASKEGYKTVTRIMEFSVIEEVPQIPFVTPRWDINGDGIVDYKDLAILGAHYGETTEPPYPRYDINRDGEVGPGDRDVLVEHYGEEVMP